MKWGAGAFPWASCLLALGISNFANARNASEPLGHLVGDIEENFPALLHEKDEVAIPAATPLPKGGIAAQIGPNTTHVYQVPLSSLNATDGLSLSECTRSPLDGGELRLISGNFSETTEDGLLLVHDFSEFNSTVSVVSPAGNASDYWRYELGYGSSASFALEAEGLYLVDSDFANALFVTSAYKNFSRLIDHTPFKHIVNSTDLNSTTHKFTLFLHPSNRTTENLHDRVHDKLGKSYCAIQDSALLNQNNADFSTTDRSNNQSEDIYRGQFLFKGLNKSTRYQMRLGIPPLPGYTGGVLFAPVPFRTKTSTTCQLIYNLTMCPQTAFTVPGNASAFTPERLAKFYDDAVADYYRNFSKALDQINCNDTLDNRFSVFSTCDQCASSYRDWLCTVAVPRCADWGNDAPYLRERLPGQSRNPLINDILRPGKYKEILPCYWLCDSIATYCPTSLQFNCPTGKALNFSYGWQLDNGDVSCSYPGAVYRQDAAWRVRPSLAIVGFALLCLVI